MSALAAAAAFAGALVGCGVGFVVGTRYLVRLLRAQGAPYGPRIAPDEREVRATTTALAERRGRPDAAHLLVGYVRDTARSLQMRRPS